MGSPDLLQRFLLEDAAVRGEIVHLETTWQQVLGRCDYPLVLRDILGELIAAGALLAATLKFSGSLIMQIRARGPINLLVVECTDDFKIRAMAQWKKEPEYLPLQELFADGHLAITIDPKNGKERYQAVVELSGATIAEVLEHYLDQSEQLTTCLRLAADSHRATGLLLQKLPPNENCDDDTWKRVVDLGTALSIEDQHRLTIQDIVHRLYETESIMLYEPRAVQFSCPCTRERVGNALRLLGYVEIMDIINEQEKVAVTCEFCNKYYVFDRIDAEQLFRVANPNAAQLTQH